MKKRGPKPAAVPPQNTEPTAYELANLAVGLSHTNDWGRSSETLVKNALAFWIDARDVLKKWREDPASVFPSALTPTPQSLPPPKRYPVTLDQFLLLMVPTLRGRTGDRYGLFREYLDFRLRHPLPPVQTRVSDSPLMGGVWFDCLNPQVVPGVHTPYAMEAKTTVKPVEPTKEDVDRYFALWRSKPIPDCNSFHYHARAFRDWYQKHYVATKADSAFKKHAKAKLRKQLWQRSAQADPKFQVPFKDFPKVTAEQMTRLIELNKGTPFKEYKNWNYEIDRSG